MKKICLAVFLLICRTLNCQIFEIPFKEESNLKILEGHISNVKINFIFDTGASKTLISETDWNKITLANNDFVAIRQDTFLIADGSFTIGKIYQVPKLNIGEVFVGPIEIVVISGSNTNLLGQNFLSNFKSYTVLKHSIEFNCALSNSFFGLDLNRSLSNLGFAKLDYYEAPISQFGKTLKFNPSITEFNENFRSLNFQDIYLTFNEKEECYLVTVKEVVADGIFDNRIYRRFNEFFQLLQREYGNPIEKHKTIEKNETVKWSNNVHDLVLQLDWLSQTIWLYYLKK